MKILITGAHFTPAKAVIEEFNKRPDVKIIYVGRGTTLEGDNTPSSESLEINKLNVEYLTLTTGRLRRFFDIYTILSLMKIPVGMLQALFIILKRKPDVILSFGGYVSVPVVLAGWFFSIPIIIHEQGLNPGLANRICGFFSDRIALSFDRYEKIIRKVIITGNPLRAEILNPVKSLRADYQGIFSLSRKLNLPVILITGGNQGSHFINTTAENCLQEILKIALVIHQTGDSKFNDYERLKKNQNERYLVTKWIGQEIGLILSKVDLCICRAGINTLTEASYFGIPSLVIPIVNHSEQNLNARFFQKLGLAFVMPQGTLTSRRLAERIKLMLKDIAIWKKNAEKAKIIVSKDAAKRLVLETILLATEIKK